MFHRQQVNTNIHTALYRSLHTRDTHRSPVGEAACSSVSVIETKSGGDYCLILTHFFADTSDVRSVFFHLLTGTFPVQKLLCFLFYNILFCYANAIVLSQIVWLSSGN